MLDAPRSGGFQTSGICQFDVYKLWGVVVTSRGDLNSSLDVPVR